MYVFSLQVAAPCRCGHTQVKDIAKFLGGGVEWVQHKMEFRKSYNFRHNALWVLLRYEIMPFQNDFHN